MDVQRPGDQSVFVEVWYNGKEIRFLRIGPCSKKAYEQRQRITKIW
ncbi:MAG: hypothetical protein HXS54_07775 [Theionarchaea archaeon]|nr:hypothetical protein [Theionarchaea archaeon]